MFRKLIFLTVTLAILSATISPACAFISGKYGDWVEICNGLEMTKIQTKTQSELPKVTQDSCQFCFQHAHMTGLEFTVIDVLDIKSLNFINGFYNQSALSKHAKTTKARAPPTLS